MIDPLSIAAASGALATSLLRCIDYLHTISQRISTSDASLANLQSELLSLKTQVHSVESSLSKQYTRSGYQQYWQDFDEAVKQCQRMIGDMERQLGRIADIEGGWLGGNKVKKALAIWWTGVGVGLVLEEIKIYRRTMKMSLQFIAVEALMQNEDENVRLAGKVDHLTAQVTKLTSHIRSLNIINPTTTTLRNYLQSANEAVQSAASVVSSRSTVDGGSVAGSIIAPLLPESKRGRIVKWLHEPIIEERELSQSPLSNIESDDDTEYTGYDQLPSRAGGGGNRDYDDIETRQSSIGDPTTQPGKLDFEILTLDGIQKLAISKFSAQDYKEARDLFERFKQKSEQKYSSDTERTFPFRDQTLEHLVICSIHLWDWGSAEQLLVDHFMGREKVLHMLVGRYIHHKKFNEALRLLLHERDMLAESSARPGFGSNKLRAGGIAAEAHLCHLLAEVYLGLGQFAKAKLECRKAVMEKLALWGNEDVSYHMSISLLGEIHELSDEVGDSSEASIYHEMVPRGIEECNEIERLQRMEPPDAADEIEKFFGKVFSRLSIPWSEIRTNIRKSGDSILGTGHGYSVLHAFVENDNLYAVALLLSKGMPVNAATSLGTTPLHMAVKKGNKAMLQLLLEKGGNIFKEDGENYTVLGRAIVDGRNAAAEIVRLLIANGAQLNGFARNGNMPTKPLILAVEFGKANLVRALLDEGADIETKDAQGTTPLIKAAQVSRKEEIKILLGKKANINATNNKAETPLIAAIKARSDEIAILLLRSGADMECKDQDGETPLFIAAKMGLLGVVMEMVDRGLVTEVGYPKGLTPVEVAQRNGHTAVVEVLQAAARNNKPRLLRLLTRRSNVPAGESNGKRVAQTIPVLSPVSVPSRVGSVPVPEWPGYGAWEANSRSVNQRQIPRQVVEQPKKSVWRGRISEDSDSDEDECPVFSHALFPESREEDIIRRVES